MNAKYPHLYAALLALTVGFGLLAYGTTYAQSLERKYVHALAPLMLPQSGMGSALQQAAFQQPDLLVVYGSSEMLAGNTPYRALQFFQKYPTGFGVYDVGKNGATSLVIAQDLAAIGPALRGKKVVFSFTPTMFSASQVDPFYYARDFSRLHANALIFNSFLSLETKQIAATRMNDYPDTLKNDPVLQFAVQQLACGCEYGSYLYHLALPLGQLDTWIIRLQDHWEAVHYVWGHPELSPQVPRKPARIDWARKLARAVTTDKMHSNNNPYGIQNEIWTNVYAKILAPPKEAGSADAQFRRNLDNSKEWTDFDLTLRVLRELGAKPLILSRPINGPIWNAMGVSWLARRGYYDRLQSTISAYGFPLVDFVDHDSDPYFSYDVSSHTSRAGWVYIDQTLDGFFHGMIH